jgi:hypothetical protein
MDKQTIENLRGVKISTFNVSDGFVTSGDKVYENKKAKA